MEGLKILYKVAAASQAWLGGPQQQIPLGHSTATDTMRPSLTSVALLASSTIYAKENLNGVVCSAYTSPESS
jgi:hypothetical protein